MYLIRLIYASRLEQGVKQADIQDIVRVAEKNNEKKAITGMLAYNHKYFLQCLEGDRESVNALYAKILNDTRHHSAVILDYQEISERYFYDWAMGYVPSTKINQEMILQYSTTPDFEPALMNGESVFGLLKQLSRALTKA